MGSLRKGEDTICFGNNGTGKYMGDIHRGKKKGSNNGDGDLGNGMVNSMKGSALFVGVVLGARPPVSRPFI
jgi:hypothetical protein